MIVSVMCMYISCVDLCVHVFMNPMMSLLVCVFLTSSIILCYDSGFYMLLVLRQMFMMHIYIYIYIYIYI